jgi:hypothetical protein
MQGNAHRQLPALREEYSKKERTETTMRNNYEASEVFEFGYAHDVVSGLCRNKTSTRPMNEPNS